MEEIICEPFRLHFQAAEVKFHTAGREDVDVRMLGNGRPFVVELINPKRGAKFSTPDFLAEAKAAIAESLGGAVEVHELRAADKSIMSAMQDGAEMKRKNYRCVVRLSRPITPADIDTLSSVRALEVIQNTPLRVLHRRTLMARPKTVFSISCEQLNDRCMMLRICTSAGAYIKEFVHSDFGRTSPSVSSILSCAADILQLDVESILTG